MVSLALIVEDYIMKRTGFLMAVLLMPLLVWSQTVSPNDSQGSGNNVESQQKRNSVSITGCLTRNSHNQYELVDQKGVRNLLYGSVPLDSYVGQSVTLVGARSATPSTDTGTARPMPHFKVSDVRPASGQCK